MSLVHKLKIIYNKGGKRVKKPVAISAILKQKSGASLLIVLACMMFLITLATITLTSSLGVASTTQHNKDKTQIDLLAQSVQMSLQDMLNSSIVSGGGTDNLQTAIVKSYYNNKNAADPATVPLFDKLTISVDETVTQADGSTTIITHIFECEIEIQLEEQSAGNVTGALWVNANIDLDPLDTNLAGQAEYRMGFRLDTATYDDTSDTVTNYGEWTLVEYEKIEN